MRIRFFIVTLLVLIGPVRTALPAAADQAIVVGVNHYARLPAGYDLKGCINDARAMTTLLKQYGFGVTVLTDATRQQILDTLQQMQSRVQPTERFVFYFAGHGTRVANGLSDLLPSDADVRSRQNDIGKEDLYAAVHAIPARSRTVLVDSCFSGGLTRNLGRRVKAIRFFARAAQPAEVEPVNDKDNNDHLVGGEDVCYFTAALANQTSGEDDFNGQRGVFTHFLVQRLSAKKTSLRWGDVQKDVTGSVSDYMQETQTPKFSPTDFANVALFDGKEAPQAPPDTNRTVWDDYNEDFTDPTRLQVQMNPNRSEIKVNTSTTAPDPDSKFNLTVTVGGDGYLVLLDRDVDGKVYLLFPKSGQVDDARVSAGDIRFPTDPGKDYAPDTPGMERVKAILFTTPERAAALLNAFPKEGAPAAKLRRLVEVQTDQKPFYTSVLSFGVVPRSGATTGASK